MASDITIEKLRATDFNAGISTQINFGRREYPIYLIKGDTLYNTLVTSPTDMSATDFRINWDSKTGTMTYRPELIYEDIPYYGMEDGKLFAVDTSGNKLQIELGNDKSPEALRNRSSNLTTVTESYCIHTHEGTFRDLTFNKILMLITLQRSEIMERIILDRSRTLFSTTEMLELSNVCLAYLNDHTASLNVHKQLPASESNPAASLWRLLTVNLGIPADKLPTPDANGNWDRKQIQEAFGTITKVQDKFNTTAQTTLIDIESFAHRRDEMYNLGTNSMKQTLANEINMARYF